MSQPTLLPNADGAAAEAALDRSHVSCSACDLDFGPSRPPAEASYLADVHNDLHHGGHGIAQTSDHAEDSHRHHLDTDAHTPAMADPLQLHDEDLDDLW